MSSFWSWFITLLTLANILGCWWLLRWTAKPIAGESAEGEPTDHVWDGDLRELNNPMPRWWLTMFYISIAFALLYLVLYPGLGRFEGVLGWTQVGQWEEEVAKARDSYGAIFNEWAATDVEELIHNPDAMAAGSRLFGNNCAVCHGSDARGAPGFPNLADDAWLYGGSPAAIRHSIAQGRRGVMPPMGAVLGDEGVSQVAAYVYSLNGRSAPAQLTRAGKQKFEASCAACHGADGTGNQALGAPNLTDDAWLYGGSLAAIEQSIREGRQGLMPAHEQLLDEERIHVLTAYVYSLSQDEASIEE
ncbi:cytochrome-c oxidase, cbb3-type subunit III [Alkalilimnicola sp. S0819]|uniref:cytochrome-c oxidase, cbb3-type subunit III n=1 Tax=Alkalilimnicola sp. S0819 TaxID=2613922 RepID=UPI0012620AD2|nr:cytochrome-c oxidase, cbb3-type subunit III [Alkalilimnicola sp. S0819]KAB7628199.1 cytochrome-c oxidase, cbb3-type subunit III [Alkalilimnicola sp. S0819]MPQ15089.1 cytochrome-c oxidase, cbb3-type subunit III [Alkalilimnicola sp. S0819]